MRASTRLASGAPSSECCLAIRRGAEVATATAPLYRRARGGQRGRSRGRGDGLRATPRPRRSLRRRADRGSAFRRVRKMTSACFIRRSASDTQSAPAAPLAVEGNRRQRRRLHVARLHCRWRRHAMARSARTDRRERRTLRTRRSHRLSAPRIQWRRWFSRPAGGLDTGLSARRRARRVRLHCGVAQRGSR